MNPLVNSVIGLLFLTAGIVATLLMYFLRGAPVRRAVARPTPPIPGPEPAPRPEPKSQPEPQHAAVKKAEKSTASARRPASAEAEPCLADIQAMARKGQSIIEPMRTRKRVTGWDELLFQGAQLKTAPRNADQPVATKTVIGPGADHPLEIACPLVVSHMSFGALSREVKIALAKGSAAVRTAIGSGEGGILEDELAAAHKYILEYVPNQYSITDENLQRVDAVEIKIGQSAKPGMGGHLPAGKVTGEVAVVRGRPEGVDILSPACFADIRSRDDLRRKVDWLREKSGGKPIGIKLAAGHIEGDLEVALYARPDFVTIDGRPGATGAAPRMIKDNVSIPTVFALARARKYLDEHDQHAVSLLITGGLRLSPDCAKAIALGADAVALGTAALIAAGCQQYRICHTGRCPVGVATQDQRLRARLDVDQAAQRVERFLSVCINELKTFARITGHDDVHQLSTADLRTTNSELARHTAIEHV